jgi:hypothetical protein
MESVETTVVIPRRAASREASVDLPVPLVPQSSTATEARRSWRAQAMRKSDSGAPGSCAARQCDTRSSNWGRARETAAAPGRSSRRRAARLSGSAGASAARCCSNRKSLSQALSAWRSLHPIAYSVCFRRPRV